MIKRQLHPDFFTGFTSLTTGEKVAGGITIFTGLAMAYILEL